MKTATKISKNLNTPETVTGSCMSGKLMTKDEAKKMAHWVAQQKTKQSTKATIQKLVS